MIKRQQKCMWNRKRHGIWHRIHLWNLVWRNTLVVAEWTGNGYELAGWLISTSRLKASINELFTKVGGFHPLWCNLYALVILTSVDQKMQLFIVTQICHYSQKSFFLTKKILLFQMFSFFLNQFYLGFYHTWALDFLEPLIFLNKTCGMVTTRSNIVASISLDVLFTVDKPLFMKVACSLNAV